MKPRGLKSQSVGAVVLAAALSMLVGCDSGGGDAGSGNTKTSVIPPSISSSSLPLADVTMPYRATLAATGTPEIKWALIGGALAPGLTLLESGSIEGTPTTQGTWSLTVSASSTAGSDARTLALTVRPRITSVSTGVSGVRSNGDSGIYPTYGGESALSGDGRFIVFQSAASNLVNGDTNGKRDLFLQDRQTGVITRVSVGNNGAEANEPTVAGTISEEGTIVAFHSLATNLVLADTNASAPGGGGGDVFVHDPLKGETTRVSVVSLSGAEGTCSAPPAGGLPCTSFDPALDYTGNLVAFGSTFTNLVTGDTNGVADVFLHNRTSKMTARISIGPSGLEADGASGNPGVSADGRYVVFESMATNLLGPGNDVNGSSDIFVHDRTTDSTVLVSRNQAGLPGNWHSFTPSISRDGKWIAFWSVADNLVDNDTNGVADVFVVDWQAATPTMRRISVSASGAEGNGDSRVPVLTRDGRHVVFESEASNLLDGGGDTNGSADIYIVDVFGGGVDRIKRASVSASGAEALGGASVTPSISADGRFVSFTSNAINLVADDTNGVADVFVTQRP